MRRLLVLALISLALPAAGTAAFPGTNGRLLFTQERSSFERSVPAITSLCAATPDGVRPSTVAESPHRISIEYPAASPGGGFVAYVRGGSVYIAQVDGSGERLLAAGTMPAWTPDSTRLVYTVLGDLELARADGTARTRLTADARYEQMPAVSPDGSTVAYVRGPLFGFTGTELVLLSLVDGSERVLVSGPGIAAPDWAPDGRRLALALGTSVVTIGVDGGGLRTVAESAGEPAFSPDGRRLAFERDGDIWTAAADGSDLVNVTRSPPRERQPTWQNGEAARPAGSDRPCAIVGSEGGEELVGSEYGDIFYDLGGDDVIRAGGGDDVVYDGDGLDRIEGGDGADLILLQLGANTVFGGPGDDMVNAIAGFYQHASAELPQQVYGEDGADMITGGTAADRIEGGPGKDVLNGNKGPDVLLGGPEADRIAGNRGDDSIQGNQGDDVLFGGLTSGLPLDYDGYDVLVGGEGADRLAGGWQRDRLFGGPGNDRLAGGRHADVLVGEAGVDVFLGEHGDDLLLARDGRREQVSGGPGVDRARLDPVDRSLGVERAIR